MAKRRKIRVKRKLPIFVFTFLMAALFFAGYTLAKELIFPDFPQSDEVAIGEDEIPNLEGRLNVLLLGTDARKGETKARTDTIILVSVDKETNRIAMLSIPRDTRVQIPGRGMDKINAANVYGGPELATKTVSKLLGVPIDYYALTRFEGFKDIVDAIGGLDFYVEHNMYYHDPTDRTLINIKKGQQRFDGQKALDFVRFRSYPNGDIERTVQQQRFLKALAEETLQPSNVVRLPKLVYSVNKCVETNMGLSQMIKLAQAAKGLNDTEIVTQTLPGRFMDIDGVSYWHVEPTSAKKAVAMLLEGQTTDVIEGRTIVQGDKKPTTVTEKEAAEIEHQWVPVGDNERDKEDKDKQETSNQGRGQGTGNTPLSEPTNTGDDGVTHWLPSGGEVPSEGVHGAQGS